MIGLHKPQLPLDVSFRDSLIGRGYVLRVENTSDKYLQLRATYKNPTLDEEMTQVLDVPAQETVEVGWGEGWKFSSGEKIFLSHADYRTLRLRIP